MMVFSRCSWAGWTPQHVAKRDLRVHGGSANTLGRDRRAEGHQQELQPAAGGVALVWLLRAAGVDPDGVLGVVAELILDAVLEAVAGAEQDDQHEDAPRDAHGGEQRPQLVAADGVEHLLPAIDVDHVRPR